MPSRDALWRRIQGAVGGFFWLWVGAVQPATARVDPALICDQAALTASAETGVPIDILRALTRTETGRNAAGRLRPWPWTVNMQGQGIWFDTEEQAQVYVFRHFKAGARSFDVGCFQINYRWHGQAFASIDAMFDPVENARYAAKFLNDLHSEFGDWSQAVGAYHSRNSHTAARYLDRYKSIRSRMQSTPLEAPYPEARPDRTNRFPLLQGTAGGGNGSLFPAAAPRAEALLAIEEEE